MTRTQDRLADALTAAARTVREETLQPLTVPERRRRPAWLAPVAAAAGVALVIGLAVAVSARLAGSGQGGGSLALSGAGNGTGPPRYYVEADVLTNRTAVRSVATGAVKAVVPIPYDTSGSDPTIAAAGDGTFFAAAFVRGTSDEHIYRFRLTGAGKVAGFAMVPGGVLGAGQQVDAMAASPDGSQLAVGISPVAQNSDAGTRFPSAPADVISIIRTATGVKTVWRGGVSAPGHSFEVASLSWTGDGHELVFLGQSCVVYLLNSETCGDGPRVAEVRTLDPSSGGGRLDSGQLLLAQSLRFPYLAQALISPDGATITAVVLTGPVKTAGPVSDGTPEVVSVEQISLAARTHQPRVLYQRNMGRTTSTNTVPDFVALSADGAGQHWMFNAGVSAGFNGWIYNGRLMPLRPVNGRIASEAW